MIDLKNDACFITAFYHDLYQTKFGGRHNRFHHYVSSLRSISKINSNIHVFCKPSQIPEIKNEVSRRNFSNLTFEGFNLEDFKYHQQINQILNGQNTVWPDRCFEIMHSKVFWMNKVLENTNYKYYFWIDAGLSYCGLFPKKYIGDVYDSLAMYYEYTLFSSKVFSNMLSFENSQNGFYLGGEKPFLMDHYPPKEILFGKNDRFKKFHVVGGLFGGTREYVQNLKQTYESYLSLYLNKGILPSEEGLLSEIISNQDEKTLKIEVFGNWHHEDSGEVFKPLLERNNNSFFKMFSKYDV
jgi:hypothetical protein